MNEGGRVAIVTGAGGAIGREIAVCMAKTGYRVVVSGRRLDNTQATADLITASGGESLVALADVTKSAEVNAVVGKTLEAYGRVDVLVNAAMQQFSPCSLQEMSDELWDSTIATNAGGYFHFCRAVLQPMMAQKSGRIINISSGQGIVGAPGYGAYAASKGAIHSMSMCLARETAAYQICVNIIAPGMVAAPLSLASAGGYDSPALQNMLKVIPMQRIAQPADVAHAALFLAAEESSFITGIVLRVDGGKNMMIV